MATSSLLYGTSTGITFDVSSRATSSTFVAGRESNEIDNTSNLFLDVLVSHRVGIQGHASTAPTIGQEIRLYCWGHHSTIGITGLDALTGSDGNITFSHLSVVNSLRLAGVATVTVATAALTYRFMPFSVASLFGGVMPEYWGLYLAHNHNGSLAASQSDMFYYTGVKLSIT